MSDNPSAFPCARCGIVASHKQGRQWLCPKHYRIGQMRAGAKRHGKTVPTPDQFEVIIPNPFQCVDCAAPMNWLARDGQCTVATLQHYRDGTHGIVCRSCNTRHAFMDGDTFRDLRPEHKICPKCKEVKPFASFSVDASRSGQMRLKSSCRECSGVSHSKWQTENRSYYNAKQREYRAARKLAARAD